MKMKIKKWNLPYENNDNNNKPHIQIYCLYTETKASTVCLFTFLYENWLNCNVVPMPTYLL